ncbi:FAD-dependent oxidoreductase [Saccharibacillus sp. CPCC 101409]|uniref:FAD-dependent oxidoreductase n=1 Tax=Saccharibacillus sp. CPCC 101409 TaxID=3058041 RepID=UPI002672C65B|nr:FAD-dependent oxidoreductase [Saccharibacillus sp. CPCC 101409]MDO3408444.1 FAD-dependent oxidoreductase [Saccharibacillus sp. CPCC 101409]
METFDVIVMGGGVSGAMAACAAAKSGANTLIVESQGYLGGTLTANGVGPMMTFHAGDKQAVQGLTDELIERLKRIGKSPGHIFDTVGYTYSVTPFDAEAMKVELESMVLENGGRILYHTVLAESHTTNGRIESVTVCNKSGLTELRAKVFIDATGDGDLSVRSGAEFTKGRESDGAAQPMTLKMKMIGADVGKVKAYIHAHPEDFPAYKGDTSIIEKAPRLSTAGFVGPFKAAKERGEISIPREDILFFETNTPGEIIFNTTRILGKDGTNAWDLSLAEIEGRKQCRELELFVKKYIPGFENAIVTSTGPSIGVRGSRQIKGLYTLNAEDILEQTRFDDAIAHSGYPIDIHSPDGEGTNSRKLEWGGMYSIPYRSLVTAELSNLIVIGRCLSATFEAQAAVRTTPTTGAIGHAGGVAAALAASGDGDVREVDVRRVQTVLKEQGAYLEV